MSVAVKIIVFVAVMYMAVLFFKNTIAKIIYLYILDAIVVTLLAIGGVPEVKLFLFSAFGFILNSFIIFLPHTMNTKYKLKALDYIFISTGVLTIIAYTVFFAVLNHDSTLVINPIKPYTAVFFVFCTVFTILYFVIKEKTGELENE